MDTALDPLLDSVAKRAGVIRTQVVTQATTLLLLRFCYHIVSQRGRGEVPLLAEECQVVGFNGRADNPHWLPAAEVEMLLQAGPDVNVPPQQAAQLMTRTVAQMADLQPAMSDIAERRGQELCCSPIL